MRRVTSLRRELTYNVTPTSKMITLQEGSLEIDMGNIPLPIGGDLTLESKTRTSTRRRISLEIPDLTILKSPKNSSGLNLQELPFFISFNGQHPATSNVIVVASFPKVNHFLGIVYTIAAP